MIDMMMKKSKELINIPPIILNRKDFFQLTASKIKVKV